MRTRPSLLALAVFGLAVGAVCASAGSLPTPGNDPDRSMIGIIVRYVPESETDTPRSAFRVRFDGPTPFSYAIGEEEQVILWTRVDPGLYTLYPNRGLTLTPGLPETIEVPPGSVVLAPFAFERSARGSRTVRTDEAARQWAGRELASQVDFPLWVNRSFIGFGSLRPEVDSEEQSYRIRITADPAESEIYVDDALVGESPLEFSLPGGKHRVLVRAAGYEDAVYYIRLEGDAEIDASLEPAAGEIKPDGPERYRTLVAPFLALDEPDDQLSRLFADTLLLALEEDPRLEPIPSAVPWETRDALTHPNFLTLEEAGADMVVTGFFGFQDERLVVQADLYDVQAETVRAAVTWYGTAGFDIFDAMDEIAVEFADEVDRVLPDAGRTLVTRKETVYAAGDRTGSILARKKIIANRWEDHPNVLSFDAGFGGLFEQIRVFGATSDNEVSRFEGPYFPMTLTWTRDLSSSFALGTGLTVALGGRNVDDNNDHGEKELTALAGAFVGPRLMFRSLRSEIVIGLSLRARYGPELEWQWDQGTPDSGISSAFLYLDVPVDFGFRYYFNSRTDTRPLFMSGGLCVSPLGYQFDLGGRDQSGFVHVDLSLYVGIGVRL